EQRSFVVRTPPIPSRSTHSSPPFDGSTARIVDQSIDGYALLACPAGYSQLIYSQFRTSHLFARNGDSMKVHIAGPANAKPERCNAFHTASDEAHGLKAINRSRSSVPNNSVTDRVPSLSSPSCSHRFMNSRRTAYSYANTRPA